MQQKRSKAMFKRFALIGLFGAAGFGIAVPAQAHYVYTFSGWLYHSVECFIGVKNVANPEKHLAVVSCTLTPIRSTVWCRNPAGYFAAGDASVGTLVGQEPIGPDDYVGNKTSGIATASVTLQPADLQVYREFCPNPNWSVEALVIDEFTSTITVKDSKGVTATTVDGHCTLPTAVQGTFPIENNTEYECDTVTAIHRN
jgi:hypothetical protein